MWRVVLPAKIDEDWVIHFEKMLYDNTQFILLLSVCKINPDNYFKQKLNKQLSF